MSDLLAIRDFDSVEFIDRLAGLYRHCQDIAARAATLQVETERRVAGIRLNTFKGLAEIGEALLRVQERHPGEFDAWFVLHEKQLGFSTRTADRCKAAAKLVREHGLDRAYELSIEKANERPPPFLALSLRLTRPLAELDDEERRELKERLQPVVDTYHALEELEDRKSLEIKAT